MTSPTEPGSRRRALVVGTGLIGGSIALGLRRRGWHVTGWDTDAGRAEQALATGVVDALGDDPEAEVAFVATPAASAAGVARLLLNDAARRTDAVATRWRGRSRSACTAPTPNSSRERCGC